MIGSRLYKLKDILPKHVRVIDRHSVYLPHSIYTKENLEAYQTTHKVPKTITDKFAFHVIQFVRKAYDVVTGYDINRMTEAKWLVRCLFLETVAGVPGIVGGMGIHLKMIRDLKRDRGRIHHLIEEAENQRFHLHIFLQLSKPGILFRLFIIAAQTIFFPFYMASFLISRKFSHRFVGYLEEQACHTYTNMLRHIDDPKLSLHHYKVIKAPQAAIAYWSLPQTATLRDVIQVIRSDEATHRQVNHFFADIEQDDIPQYQTLQIQEDAQVKLFGQQCNESKIPSEFLRLPEAQHIPGQRIVHKEKQ